MVLGQVVLGEGEPSDAAPGQAGDQLAGGVELELSLRIHPVARGYLGHAHQADRQELGGFIRSEITKFGRLAKEAGIQPE